MDRLPDIIETERLCLRRATPADAEALFALYNNWNVIRWLARPQWPAALGRLRGFLEKVNSGSDSEHYWVIERDGMVLGGISAGLQAASERQSGPGPHIGYWLGEPFWRQGVMGEAARLLVDSIFTATSALAIYSGIFDGNEGSWRIQQRLGFVIESQSMLFSTPLGREATHLNTILTREAFEAHSLG